MWCVFCGRFGNRRCYSPFCGTSKSPLGHRNFRGQRICNEGEARRRVPGPIHGEFGPGFSSDSDRRAAEPVLFPLYGAVTSKQAAMLLHLCQDTCRFCSLQPPFSTCLFEKGKTQDMHHASSPALARSWELAGLANKRHVEWRVASWAGGGQAPQAGGLEAIETGALLPCARCLDASSQAGLPTFWARAISPT
jgi:hypothetical protein